MSLVALTVACNQAQNYESTYKKEQQAAVEGDGEDAIAKDMGNHGPVPSAKNELPAPPPATPPATPPAPPPPGAPAPLNAPNAESFKKMIAQDQLYTVMTVTQGAAWGTTAAAPLTVTAYVDETGALPAPSSRAQVFTKMTRDELMKIDYNNPPVLEFITFQQGQTVPATFTGKTSLWIVCNTVANDGIYLHSGINSGPFAHGNRAIPDVETNAAGQQVAGRCGVFPVASLNYQVNQVYDHSDGQNPANSVHLKIQKVNINGVPVP